MSLVTQVIRQRQAQRKKHSRRPLGPSGLGCSLLFGLLSAALLVSLALAYAGMTRDLPSLEKLPLYLDPPDGLWLHPTQLLDRTGKHVLLTLINPAASEKTYLPLTRLKIQHLPDTLVNATIATLDPTFWDNPGYSMEGLLKGTHPTLAQQMTSELLLKDEPASLRRNLRERILAAQLTARFGREQILEWYLNSAQYGDLIYGADAAARAFFGKSAVDLSLAEAALLAAAAQAPGISPQEAPQVVLERQQQVVRDMLAYGLITSGEALQASQGNLQFKPAQQPKNLAPAFTNLVLEQLATQFPLDELERGGWLVTTSLDYDLQVQASCASSNQLSRLEGGLGDSSASDGAACSAARLLPTLSFPQVFNESQLAASVIALEPASGQVLVMVGDASPGEDPAHLPGQAPGTLFTPFIYLTAFARGFNPASLVWDIPSTTAAGSSSEGIPEQSLVFHGPVRLRTALVNDYPGPAYRLMEQIGPENVFRTADQLGLAPYVSPQVSTSLDPDQRLFDTGQVTLLSITHAFSVFANQGSLTGRFLDSSSPSEAARVSPVTILRVDDYLGKNWLDWSSTQSKPVLSSQLAYLMTQVLSDETARWPSLGHPNPLEIGRPAGVKLGRSLDGTDEWTVGYTPQIIVGVWLGQISASGSAGQAAGLPFEASGGLWHAVIQYAVQGKPSQSWSVPPGISLIEVCDPSGLLPTPACPTVVPEVFLDGSEPTQADNLYQSIQINRQTGRLATVFTPPELIQERIYLVVPPEATEWAQKAGLPTPPDMYDVIYTQTGGSADVRITAPEIFTHVRGQVTFQGSAAGDHLKFFRLQVGKGLNPTEWIQIGQDATTAVKDGVLGTWDTQGLNGLYAVQLLVVREEQHVEQSVTQVTVDNQPPDIRIISPTQDQLFTNKKELVVILQANASDNLELAKVEFYIDDLLISSVTQAPFTVSWTAKPGAHTLRIRAIDLAGNLKEDSVNFTIK